MSIFFELFVFFLSLFGFCLSLFIFLKKHEREKLICPLRTDCETVITSKYSVCCGVPVEILGIAYYGSSALVHFGIIVLPAFFGSFLMFGFIIASSAFVFSMYLIAIQAIVLRHWCTWCLCSAGISTVIFVLYCVFGNFF